MVVTKEISKLLKSKGFNEPCKCYYEESDNDFTITNKLINWNENSDFFSAPEISDCLEWILDNYRVWISVKPTRINGGISWQSVYYILGSSIGEYLGGINVNRGKTYCEIIEYILKEF